jgi:hypothetical protein
VGEECRSLSSSLCSFLQPHVNSSLIGTGYPLENENVLVIEKRKH